MKSLEARFNTIYEKNPLWSSFICFSEAARGGKFSRPTLNKWFNKLVDKSDYSKGDKKTILDQIENLSENLLNS